MPTAVWMNIRHRGMSGGNIKLRFWRGGEKKLDIYGALIYLLVVILVGEAAKPDRTSKTAQPARRLRVLSTGEIIVKLRIMRACSVQTDKWSEPLQNRDYSWGISWIWNFALCCSSVVIIVWSKGPSFRLPGEIFSEGFKDILEWHYLIGRVFIPFLHWTRQRIYDRVLYIESVPPYVDCVCWLCCEKHPLLMKKFKCQTYMFNVNTVMFQILYLILRLCFSSLKLIFIRTNTNVNI